MVASRALRKLTIEHRALECARPLTGLEAHLRVIEETSTFVLSRFIEVEKGSASHD
jgi:hypothetical protein